MVVDLCDSTQVDLLSHIHWHIAGFWTVRACHLAQKPQLRAAFQIGLGKRPVIHAQKKPSPDHAGHPEKEAADIR